MIRTAFSHYYWVLSGLPLPSLALANDDRNGQDLDCLLSHLCDRVTEQQRGKIVGTRCPECCRWVLFTYRSVTLLLSFCCFTKPSNLSTQTQGFCMCAHSAGGPRGWILLENVCLWVQIAPWKFQPISFTFTPWKSHISVLFGIPPPGGLLLSILAPKWAASTLNLCTQHCVPVSQLHIPRPNSTSTCFSTA